MIKVSLSSKLGDLFLLRRSYKFETSMKVDKCVERLENISNEKGATSFLKGVIFNFDFYQLSPEHFDFSLVLRDKNNRLAFCTGVGYITQSEKLTTVVIKTGISLAFFYYIIISFSAFIIAAIVLSRYLINSGFSVALIVFSIIFGVFMVTVVLAVSRNAILFIKKLLIDDSE